MLSSGLLFMIDHSEKDEADSLRVKKLSVEQKLLLVKPETPEPHVW